MKLKFWHVWLLVFIILPALSLFEFLPSMLLAHPGLWLADLFVPLFLSSAPFLLVQHSGAWCWSFPSELCPPTVNVVGYICVSLIYLSLCIAIDNKKKLFQTLKKQ